MLHICLGQSVYAYAWGNLQIVSEGSRMFKKIQEDSGKFKKIQESSIILRLQKIQEGSRRFKKASEDSRIFKKVQDDSRRFKKIQEGSRRFRTIQEHVIGEQHRLESNTRLNLIPESEIHVQTWALSCCHVITHMCIHAIMVTCHVCIYYQKHSWDLFGSDNNACVSNRCNINRDGWP